MPSLEMKKTQTQFDVIFKLNFDIIDIHFELILRPKSGVVSEGCLQSQSCRFCALSENQGQWVIRGVIN